MVRDALVGTDSGRPPSMPKDDPGLLVEDSHAEELKAVLAWVEAFQEARAAGEGYHAGY